MSTQPNTVPQFTMGDRLRKARSLTGLDTRAFADLLGVSHGTISNAETDRRNVRRITLNAWAMATGVPVEWLMTGQATPSGDPSGGQKWAPSDSNRQPTDYASAQVMRLRVAA